jgi:hypothetical protein
MVLGENGWYLDLIGMTLPDIFELKEKFLEGNIEEAELALSAHFERRLDKIEEFISNEFPNRQKLIKAAFEAHRRSEYELAIPVLFAQMDGICKDVGGNKYLFIKNKKTQKPSIEIYLKQIVFNEFEEATLSPLSKDLPIWKSAKERPKSFNALNRHMVLHGESLDYGTKVNSLKAISLINYVAEMLCKRNISRGSANKPPTSCAAP